LYTNAPYADLAETVLPQEIKRLLPSYCYIHKHAAFSFSHNGMCI